MRKDLFRALKAYVGVIAFGAIVAISTFLLLLFVDAQRYALQHRQELTFYSDHMVNKISRDLNRLRDVFKRREYLNIDCSDEVVNQLREELFDLIFVSELGMVSVDGYLKCTSWQKIDPPLLVQKPPKPYEFRIYGPTIVEFMQKSAFVVSMGRNDGSEINALLPMTWLDDVLNSGSPSESIGFTALIDTQSGVPVALSGTYSLPLPQGTVTFPLNHDVQHEGLMDNGSSHYLSIRVIPGWNLAVVQAQSSESLNAGIYRFDVMNFLVSLSLGIFIAFVMTRMRPKNQSLRDRVNQGIKNNEFVNYYQPIIDASNGRVSGVEILLRWHHPEEGILPPNIFIPEAERTGLIIPMTEAIVNNAIHEISDLAQSRLGFKVNINICGQHLRDQQFVERIIASTRFFPLLMLELTENELIDSSCEGVIASINMLRSQNISLAIDDFGTGYSGLRYLEELPIDVIKIDRSFVAACGTDSPSAVVLDYMARLAKDLNMSTVAEGVETEAQVTYLMDRGITLHQGWHYAKAMPVDELKRFLNGE
ncbi:EAL domain-containing protein [Litoribrevibacter euphylliae]|uniref:EAL domain-containing protein n=1 Tax=Litoribrevibacter euphylliae TaxID=1834034 RepID=A0ABV7HCJ2_9GAMM